MQIKMKVKFFIVSAKISPRQQKIFAGKKKLQKIVKLLGIYSDNVNFLIKRKVLSIQPFGSNFFFRIPRNWWYQANVLKGNGWERKIRSCQWTFSPLILQIVRKNSGKMLLNRNGSHQNHLPTSLIALDLIPTVRIHVWSQNWIHQNHVKVRWCLIYFKSFMSTTINIQIYVNCASFMLTPRSEEAA